LKAYFWLAINSLRIICVLWLVTNSMLFTYIFAPTFDGSLYRRDITVHGLRDTLIVRDHPSMIYFVTFAVKTTVKKTIRCQDMTFYYRQYSWNVIKKPSVAHTLFNPLTPTVAIWVQPYNIFPFLLCQTGLSRHLYFTSGYSDAHL